MELQKLNTRKSPFLPLFFCLTLLLGAFTGCDDDDDVAPLPVPDSVAYVSLYHVSPDAPPLAIRVDNNRINFNPFEYADHTGYLRFFTGERELLFTPFDASNTLLQTTVDLEDDQLYSVFVTGETGDLQALITEDSIPEVEGNNALVRLVHVSPDAPSVDLTATDGEDLFSAVSYRDVSGFVEIPAGTTSFDITAAGTEEAVAQVAGINFLPERVYTIVVRGYLDPPAGNPNPLSVQIVPNFFNF